MAAAAAEEEEEAEDEKPEKEENRRRGAREELAKEEEEEGGEGLGKSKTPTIRKEVGRKKKAGEGAPRGEQARRRLWDGMLIALRSMAGKKFENSKGPQASLKKKMDFRILLPFRSLPSPLLLSPPLSSSLVPTSAFPDPLFHSSGMSSPPGHLLSSNQS